MAWPSDYDGFRDVAVAQSLRDGHGLADPFYAGEIAWYSPVVPAIVAAASVRQPVARTFVRLGPWINALGPLAVFGFTRFAFGSGAALLAGTLLLFGAHDPPAWAASTYSPWLFPGVAAQPLFFATLFTWCAASERRSRDMTVAAGALLGLTFLAHPAPALIAGGVFVVLTACRLASERTPRAASNLALALAAAAIVIAPLVLPIVLKYRFHTLNRAPATWIHGGVELDVLWATAVTWRNALLAVPWAAGLWAAGKTRTIASRAVVAWGASCVLLFAYALAAERTSRVPGLVPAFHFFFSLQTWSYVLIGLGAACAVALLADVTGAKRRTASAVIAAAALVFAAARYPAYLSRATLTSIPALARGFDSSADAAAARWIRQFTPESAVIAAADEDALRIVGAAGRHTVAVPFTFSNPYVDWLPRALARDRLMRLAAEGDRTRFQATAREYGVTYVLMRTRDAAGVEQRRGAWLRPVFQLQDIVIYQVTARAAGAGQTFRERLPADTCPDVSCSLGQSLHERTARRG